jgi:hypothetical protein
LTASIGNEGHHVMEKAGKVLVLVNVGFSLMLAAVAGILLYNRIDWTNNAAKEGQPEGQLVKRDARLKEFQAAVKPTMLAWRSARGVVQARETRLNGDKTDPGDRYYYAVELARLHDDPTGKPVQQIEFAGDKDGKPTGYFVPDPANHDRPRMADVKDRYGNPLHPLTYYQKAEETVHTNLLKELAGLDAAKKKDADLTEQLIGGPKWGMGLTKRIEAEKAKRDDVIAEQEWMKPLLVNTYVETQLILQRKKSLEDRVKELEAAPAPR